MRSLKSLTDSPTCKDTDIIYILPFEPPTQCSLTHFALKFVHKTHPKKSQKSTTNVTVRHTEQSVPVGGILFNT